MLWGPLDLKELNRAHPLPSPRGLGLIIAFFALLIGARHWAAGGVYLVGLGSAIGLMALWRPRSLFLQGPNYLWHNLGLVLGWLMTPLVLTLLYMVAFVPMALILKLCGHKSFITQGRWVKREKPYRFDRIF